jgi:hypothetical protein
MNGTDHVLIVECGSNTSSLLVALTAALEVARLPTVGVARGAGLC